MGSKKMLIGIMVITSLCLSAQNIKIGYDCLSMNSAILSNALIQIKGEKFTEELLKDGFRAVMIFEVDLSGRVLGLVKMSKYYKNDSNLGKQLEQYLIQEAVQFNLCYVNDPPINDERFLSIIKKDIKERGITSVVITIEFPRLYPWLYNAYNCEQKDAGKPKLSELEYLQLQISKYLYNNDSITSRPNEVSREGCCF